MRRFLNLWRHPRPVRWGTLRCLIPVSKVFGLDRGRPIDRFYIERFLERHRADIAGRVLEIGDPGYTLRFGGERVSRADVLHKVPGNPEATLVGDLMDGAGLPSGVFDCMICTQTLQFIPDPAAAIRIIHTLLKPGGVLLATLPGISQISRYDAERWGDYWRFTETSALALFGNQFGSEAVTVESWGNVLVACAFLQGLAVHELTEPELNAQDPDYPVILTIRAVKGTER